MIYPVDTIAVGDCMAVVAKVGGKRRKEGPVTARRPQVEYEGQRWKASRLAYHLNCESVPKTPPDKTQGLVLHKCDQEWCVNPNHLYLGSARRNTQDIFERNPNVRERLSIAKIGNKNRLGYKETAENRAKLSAALKGNSRKLGKKESDETRHRKSEAHKLRHARLRGEHV